MIVTIDGPAGSGKSTAAKSLARRLGFEFLDTGAMYRAVAFALFRDGMEPIEGPRLHEWLDSLRLESPPGIVRLEGRDISGLIRTPEIAPLPAASPCCHRCGPSSGGFSDSRRTAATWSARAATRGRLFFPRRGVNSFWSPTRGNGPGGGIRNSSAAAATFRSKRSSPTRRSTTAATPAATSPRWRRP